MGENLKVVWAEFSTVSQSVFVMSLICTTYPSTITPTVENSAQVLSCWLRFVHDSYKFILPICYF